MLGTYRLVLALLVAMSHIGISVGGMNPGVVAVVGFYLISGYVMTGLLRTRHAGWEGIGGFYRDRVLRLFPQYLFIAAVTLAWWQATATQTDFLRIEPSARHIVENVLVVPLNYNMFHDIKAFTLIPPAWSLGAELQFYLLMPLVLIANVRGLALAGSIGVYVAAAFGLLHTDWFGYRLLPGVLFMFLLGSWLYDLQHGERTVAASRLALATAGAALALGAVLVGLGKVVVPYNRETLSGLALGITALYLLGPRQRRGWDEALGLMSYGVFLNHFLVRWTVFDDRVQGVAATAAYLMLSMLCAALTYLAIEKPVFALRRRLRAVGLRRAGLSDAGQVPAGVDREGAGR